MLIKDTNIYWRWKPFYEKPRNIRDLTPYFVWLKNIKNGRFLIGFLCWTWEIIYYHKNTTQKDHDLDTLVIIAIPSLDFPNCKKMFFGLFSIDKIDK
jgi:hypothetical protein